MSIENLCPFLLGLFIWLYWVAWVLYILRILIPYQIYDLQMFSSIPWVVTSLSWWCPLKTNLGFSVVFKIFIYLFLTALGLHYSLWAPLVVARGLSCPVANGILFPWSGIEPPSPALKGGFLTTGPSRKCQVFSLMKSSVFLSLYCWCRISEIQGNKDFLLCFFPKSFVSLVFRSITYLS